MVEINLRYERNKNLISEAQQAELSRLTVSIVGLGGLGSYIAEEFARLGVGGLKLIDSDKFEATNLNRQLYSTEHNLGKEKATAAMERISKINSGVATCTFNEHLNGENGDSVLRDCDLVFGAVDNVGTRLVLEKICERLGVTLIDGAIGGWYGQITVVKPGEHTLSKIYSNEGSGEELELGNPPFICAVVASIQVAEGLKELLCNRETSRGRVLTVDMLNHCYEKFQI